MAGVEREWREAIDMRSSLVNLGLVLLSGALLRFWDLQSGTPTLAESQLVEAVLHAMRSGTLRPESLHHPTLPLYVNLAVAITHFLAGAVRGTWHNLNGFEAGDVLAWGRGVSAVFGTVAIFLVYQIGMRWGSRHALLGAGLMAVSPTHVAASRVMGDGSLLTFFAALALLHSVEAIEERSGRKGVFRAGVVAGLATACHYAGAVVLAMPLIATWMSVRDDSTRVSRARTATLAWLGAFVLVMPYSVLDLPGFLNGFAGAAFPPGGPVRSRIDIIAQLQWALQWPGLLLALGGLGLGIVRAVTGPGHTRWTVLVGFPLVFFGVVLAHGATADAILLPMVPSVSIIAAIAVISGVSLLRRFDIPRAVRTALIAALTVIAILPGAVFSIDIVREATHERR